MLPINLPWTEIWIICMCMLVSGTLCKVVDFCHWIGMEEYLLSPSCWDVGKDIYINSEVNRNSLTTKIEGLQCRCHQYFAIIITAMCYILLLILTTGISAPFTRFGLCEVTFTGTTQKLFLNKYELIGYLFIIYIIWYT